jgi:hypothetical protein
MFVPHPMSYNYTKQERGQIPAHETKVVTTMILGEHNNERSMNDSMWRYLKG